MAASDAHRLGLLLHPDFRWTSHTGERFDRAGYLASNTGGRTVWRAQDLGAPDVTVVGSTAVLHTVVSDSVERDTGTQVFRMPMTQIWVRVDGGWQCLAGHAGPLLDVSPA